MHAGTQEQEPVGTGEGAGAHARTADVLRWWGVVTLTTWQNETLERGVVDGLSLGEAIDMAEEQRAVFAAEGWQDNGEGGHMLRPDGEVVYIYVISSSGGEGTEEKI